MKNYKATLYGAVTYSVVSTCWNINYISRENGTCIAKMELSLDINWLQAIMSEGTKSRQCCG